MNTLDTRACRVLRILTASLFLLTAPIGAGFGNGGMVVLPLVLGLVLVIVTIADEDLEATTRHHIELGASALLALSPWLLGFADHAWRPHLFIGQMGIATALLTQKMGEWRNAPPPLMTLLKSTPPPNPTGAPVTRTRRPDTGRTAPENVEA